MEKVLIITGGSKGIGNGITKEYKKKGYRIFSISRTTYDNKNFDKVEQIQFDLSTSKNIEDILPGIFKLLNKDKTERITLINNAATLGNTGRFENNSVTDIEKTIQLNIVAPLILTAAFLRFTAGWECCKKIINITSGAAKKTFYGWTAYCSTKAGIEMMTKSIAIEQNNIENGTKIISINPGGVDTEMQEEIRKTAESSFIEVGRFINYKNSGSLTDKDEVGKEIYAIDHSEAYENGSIINIADTRKAADNIHISKTGAEGILVNFRKYPGI
jgi:benzil reductase ((S)-benzoin forming)